jgi:Cu(I)/Ag(I) efflux system membrane fusion protein
MKSFSTSLSARMVGIALLILIAYLLGRGCSPDAMEDGDTHDHAGSAQAGSDEDASDEIAFWTCSMDPQVKQDGPGDCPICGMDLIPVSSGAADDPGPDALRLEEGQRRHAGIRTTTVERLPARHELTLYGRLDYDETGVASLTARVGGRLEKLFVAYTGVEVAVGDPMVEIYSPQLFQAQQELFVAQRASDRGSDDPALRRIDEATAKAARRKLELLGFDGAQLDAILAVGEPTDRFTLTAPGSGVVIRMQAVEGKYVQEGAPLYAIADLSTLWLQLDAFESDLPWLRPGQDVDFSVDAYPGEQFHGKVVFLSPTLDATTRTVSVRVEVPNADARLRPQMFARARVLAEIEADGDPLVIPAGAPLLTGESAVVFVQRPAEKAEDGEEETAFIYEARTITLGPRAGDWFLVGDGLKEGEIIVSRGAFTLDSEMQLLGKNSMMAPPPQEETTAVETTASDDAFRGGVGRLLVAAVAVSKAFAADDLPAAHSALSDVGTALAALEADRLPLASIKTARTRIAAVETAIKAVHMADGLEAARVAFEPLQMELMTLAETFGYSVEGDDAPAVAIFHCPMAFDNRGADWLQFSGERVENPYFGSGMFRCGSETRALPTTPEGE